MHDEDVDARVGKALHARLEMQLRSQTRVRCVVGVAGDHQELRVALETRVDDAVERGEGRVRERGAHAGVVGAHARERRVEMQIRCVDEPHALAQVGLLNVAG